MPLARGELAAVLRPGEARGRLDALLAELNAPQRAAATRPAGPLLVVAGPGAGKTRVIAARVAYLLLGRGVPPGEVAAITFSRRAAGELEGRLAALSSRRGSGPDGYAGGRPEGGVWAGTFHALGARILRRGGAAQFERPPGFTIYDAEDTERTLRRILGALGVPANRVSRLAPAAGQAISLAKRQRPAGGASAPAAEMIGEEAGALPLEEVLPRYDAALQEAAAFDFDDLVGLAAVALDRDPALRAWARAGARHLLVDEYQDTDSAQEALLRRLAPPPDSPDICVVADPQQSIYAFRGAAPEQVRRFLAAWPGAAVARLEQNYRSTKSIVAVARRLVAPRDEPAPETRGKGSLEASGASPQARLFVLRLWTENPAGAPARLWVAPHPEQEAGAIARDVRALLDGTADEPPAAPAPDTDAAPGGEASQGGGAIHGGTSQPWAPEDFAILVRTHAQARPIEAALLRAGIPYTLVGGVRFFAREEIKDALAYLRLAVLREDAAAFWRIVNTPRRGLGPAALLTIARYALSGAPARLEATSRTAAKRVSREGVVTGAPTQGGPVAGSRRWAATEGAPDGLYDLLAHVDELAGLWYAGEGPAALLETALQRTSYREHLRREHPDTYRTRLDAIDELLRLAAPYEDVRRFLDDAALSGEADDPQAQEAHARGRVRLSTVHAAKGLEFRAVYVPGCEAGLFPLGPRGATPPSADAETVSAPDPEERRVFYVAVTRARERLTLSYCTFRRDERTRPSPFLAEIGRGLLRRARLGTSSPPAPRKPKRNSGATPPAQNLPRT